MPPNRPSTRALVALGLCLAVVVLFVVFFIALSAAGPAKAAGPAQAAAPAQASSSTKAFSPALIAASPRFAPA